MKPEGWGPWNVRAVNALVHLPSGLELRIGIKTPDGKEHWELRWKQMDRLGPLWEWMSEGTSRRMGQLHLRLDGARFHFYFLAADDGLSVGVGPLNDAAKACTALVRLRYNWAEGQAIPLDRQLGAVHAVAESVAATLALSTANWFQRWKYREGGFELPTHPLTPGGTDVAIALSDSVGAVVNTTLPYSEWDDTLKGQSGAASDMPDLRFDSTRLSAANELDEVLWRGVAWNTIYHPRLKRLLTPVSRDWCVDDNNFGDYVLFPWDTFFCSLLASRRDKDLAYANVRAMLAEMTDRGMLPNVNGGAGQTLDRSQPPVGAYCVWKLHQKFNDLEFLAEVYPPLKRWHDFWMKYRDGNGDGLLEWGSDPIPAPVDWWKPHTQQAAKWESGLDNSPMYENVPFNEEANTLELADIGLSCLYAADADALASIADALGLADEAAAYRAEYAQVAKRINEDLWDKEHGIYCNRHWDGRLSERWSPTSFYALYAGVAAPERAERCVREHLMNPDEFWGEWVIPSISRKDANFPVQKYWQGRVWPPMNFLCYEGLRRYGFHAEADELAAKSEALFLKEWREEGHIHENYNAITADGDDVNPDDPEGSSDPIYTWGGLLAYIALDARERAQDSGAGIPG
ncbi:MAG TPA: trehalase family glycosidase [Armatimonadota bacterium]|jgi:hypothetical protein